MPIKVVNNTGGTLGTQILDVESGADLSLMVESLSIDFGDVNCVVKGKFILGMVHCETKLHDAVWMIMDPISMNYREIEIIKFKNGNTIRFRENGDVLFFDKGEHVKLIPVSDGRTHYFNAVPVVKSNHAPDFTFNETFSSDKE